MPIRILKKANSAKPEPLTPRPQDRTPYEATRSPMEARQPADPTPPLPSGKDALQKPPARAYAHVPWNEKPIATHPDQHREDPNRYRSPPPRACTFCGHRYSFPCDGQSDKCMNAMFVRERQAREVSET